MLLPHTVLSELYQEKLVTENEVKWQMKEGRDLLYQLIYIQYTKPSEVVTRTADLMAKVGHTMEARRLRGW